MNDRTDKQCVSGSIQISKNKPSFEQYGKNLNSISLKIPQPGPLSLFYLKFQIVDILEKLLH